MVGCEYMFSVEVSSISMSEYNWIWDCVCSLPVMRSHVTIKWIFGDVPLTRIPMGLLRDRTIINVLVLVITVYFSSLFLWALIKQSPWCEGNVDLIGGCQDADHPLLSWCILGRMEVRKWGDASGGHLLIVHLVNMWQKMNSSPSSNRVHTAHASLGPGEKLHVLTFTT